MIDFGYVVRHRQDLDDFRLPIQLSWLVRELRYDWIPAQGRGTAYLIARAEQLDVKAAKERRTIRFTAKDLPPVANEPMMPPDDEIRASITTYYTMYSKDKKFFWPDAARNVEERLHTFLTKDQPVFAKTQALKKAIKEMEIPQDADLGTKVRLAYEWMKKNIENLRTGRPRRGRRMPQARSTTIGRTRRCGSSMPGERRSFSWTS